MAVTFPQGFQAGTAACGIKAFTAGASAIPTGQRDDLCVIHSPLPCDAGGVFTTNKVKSASVVIDPAAVRSHVRRIGNLALLRAATNSDLRSADFATKRAVYRETPYVLTSQIATVDEWTPATISRRQQTLAELALRTWPL